MKERFLKLAIASSFGLLAGTTPALLSADDCYNDCYSSNPCCEEQCFAVFADYLYWNVCPSSLSFASENTPFPVTLTRPLSSTAVPPINLIDPLNNLGGVRDHHVHTKYKSGFRVGFAYHMPDQWDFEATYTYFHPTYKSHRFAEGSNYFSPCGLPTYHVSAPYIPTATANGTAVVVPPQPFTLVSGTGGNTVTPVVPTSPFTAVAFVNGVTGDPAVAAFGPVTGYLTGTGVLTTPSTPPSTFTLGGETPTIVLADLNTVVTAEPTITVDPIVLPVAVPTIGFNSARVSADIKYDIVDILLARRYDCGGCFDYVPYIGARIFSFEQEICTNYTISGSDSAGNSSSVGLLLHTKHKLKLPSAGLTFGSRMNYAICDCFNLFGHIGASILGGSAKQHFTWDNSVLLQALSNARSSIIENSGLPLNSVITSDIPRTHRHGKHCQVIFGLDASVGIGYEWCLCNIPVLLGVGYEVQSWWNMPQHRGAETCCGKGSNSFTVQGLFVRLGLGF